MLVPAYSRDKVGEVILFIGPASVSERDKLLLLYRALLQVRQRYAGLVYTTDLYLYNYVAQGCENPHFHTPEQHSNTNLTPHVDSIMSVWRWISPVSLEQWFSYCGQ